VEHLLEDDGPRICRICLFAWGRLAADLAAGTVTTEPSIIELRHRTHAVPLLACPRCRTLGFVRRFRALDGLF
jgi:hypothetical protein